MAKSAVIIGASRGLGLGLAHEFARRGWAVVATARDPARADALTALAGAQAHLHVETADLHDPAGIAALAGRLAGQRFDLIFVSAGVYGPRHQSTQQTDTAEFGALAYTNAVAPVRTARTLLPLLSEAGSVGFMTSGLGSVAGNTSGAMELYRASKAALNSLARSFAATDFKGRSGAVLNIHPGWVKTDMGTDAADIDVATSVAGIADVLTAERPAGSYFLDYRGRTLPW